MGNLEEAITVALASGGKRPEVNKAYLEFLKANFIIPIDKNSAAEPEVLYLQEDGHLFLPVFTNMIYFEQWAQDIKDKIHLLKLSAVDLLKGIGENVTVSLNIGSAIYKEFNPAELARLRSMVLKLFK